MRDATGARARLWLLALVLVAVLTALAAAGCGDDDEGGDTAGGAAANEDVSGSLSISGIWAGQEQESFQAVIDRFNEDYPNVNVSYNSAGDNLPTVLQTAVQGGNPPDIAFIAQPGTIQGFVTDGALQPIDFARDAVVENFGESIADIGTFDGKLYGILFKSANKSLGWYNTTVFEDAGVEPPTTLDELVTAADTIKASGVAPFSIAGADGWTLTDLFENIYLRTAGPEKYDQLAAHEIPWTDPTVIEALEEMRKVIGTSANIAGGTRDALQVDFPRSVQQLFTDPPQAAMTFEGDFVAGNIRNETNAQEGDFGVFTFPSVKDSGPVVVGAGDIGVLFRDSPAGQAFMNFLTTPEAAEAWASRGGFLSANQNLDPSVYPDDITRQIATDLADAETFRFDMSDLAPPAFGGTAGQGEWKLLQDFLRNPGDAQAIARQLEQAAARAYR
ncbi:ABC transporter substrate-binding protein [Miltoncostaea marina]|uniref:ABC transporter substrate-binding protein n=1 Tax=Miltoncostaea marina TaxID=2843215 RepID=UPI001C3CCCB0|nr:extracellular solute-binding protein [Miltoncostaea marina]